MSKIFINHTNHPSEKWSEEQRAAAEKYGPIQDASFPLIPPEWDEAQVDALAEEMAGMFLKMKPAAVMVQGEFTYSYALISKLKAAGILVLAACSERVVNETTDALGHTLRISNFRFVRFRRY